MDLERLVNFENAVIYIYTCVRRVGISPILGGWDPTSNGGFPGESRSSASCFQGFVHPRHASALTSHNEKSTNGDTEPWPTHTHRVLVALSVCRVHRATRPIAKIPCGLLCVRRSPATGADPMGQGSLTLRLFLDSTRSEIKPRRPRHRSRCAICEVCR